MEKNKIREIINWMILLAPFPFLLLNWDRFPEQVPTHFNIEGQPDDYSSKAFGLLLLPVVNIIMYFVFRFFPKIDPREGNYALFRPKYLTLGLFINLFMLYIFFLISFYALGHRPDLEKSIFYPLMGLMLVLSNYMGSIRNNYFIGIRTPWTLENEEVWKKTHRFAGKYMFALTLAVIALSFLLDIYMLIIPYFILFAIVPVLYSYFIYRRIKTKNQ
jgi:uncharacterized membrane protein